MSSKLYCDKQGKPFYTPERQLQVLQKINIDCRESLTPTELILLQQYAGSCMTSFELYHFSLTGSHETHTMHPERVRRAIAFIYNTLDQPLSKEWIQQLHHSLFNGFFSHAGTFRTVDMHIHQRSCGGVYKYIDVMLDNLVQWYEAHKTALSPVTLAAVIHNEYEIIHPFVDGNGRTGRLLLAAVLMRHGLPGVTIDRANYKLYTAAVYEYNKYGHNDPLCRVIINELRRLLQKIKTPGSNGSVCV